LSRAVKTEVSVSMLKRTKVGGLQGSRLVTDEI
jgi:hypothetical protein